MEMKKQKRNSEGIIFVLVAAALFSLGGLCIKMVPWSPMAINGARSLISVMVLAIYLKKIKHKLVVNPAVIGCPLVLGETDFGIQAISGILILGAFQMAIAYIFMTKGLEQVSAVTASLTTAIEPILNPLLVAFFWGEMVTPLSLVGAIIVVVSIVGYNLIKKDSL